MRSHVHVYKLVDWGFCMTCAGAEEDDASKVEYKCKCGLKFKFSCPLEVYMSLPEVIKGVRISKQDQEWAEVEKALANEAAS